MVRLEQYDFIVFKIRHSGNKSLPIPISRPQALTRFDLVGANPVRICQFYFSLTGAYGEFVGRYGNGVMRDVFSYNILRRAGVMHWGKRKTVPLSERIKHHTLVSTDNLPLRREYVTQLWAELLCQHIADRNRSQETEPLAVFFCRIR